MKAEDLKTKTNDELQKLLLETRKEQFNLRFQKTNGTLDNVSELQKKRRLVARIKTFMKQNQTQDKKPAPKKTDAKAKKASSKKAA